MRERRVESWVVYRKVVKGQAVEINAMCEVSEWDALQAAYPGLLTLIRYGIKSEGEAERLARGASGDPVPRHAVRPAKSILIP
jgi:hypothetical protein